jgi:hypothetical protein
MIYQLVEIRKGKSVVKIKVIKSPTEVRFLEIASEV